MTTMSIHVRICIWVLNFCKLKALEVLMGALRIVVVLLL